MTEQAENFALVTVAARELIVVIGNLSDLMEQETAHLNAQRMAEFSALQDRKMAMIRRYETLAKDLSDCPTLDRDLEPPLRQSLREALPRMRDAMTQNQVSIEAARQVNQRLAMAIAQSVREQRSPGGIYGAAGQVAASRSTAPLSVQIDQQL